MGGYGSGRRWYLTKTTVEDCLKLDANDFARPGFFKYEQYSGISRWTRNGNETGACRYCIHINENEAVIIFSYNYRGVEHPDVKVNLSPYTPGFGGKRFFFVCPICSQRKRTLHIKRGEIACRLCHDLTYEICTKSHYFDSVYRQMAAGMRVPWDAVKGFVNMNMRAAKKEPKRPRGRPRKVRTEVA
jgi:hypothetical protein